MGVTAAGWALLIGGALVLAAVAILARLDGPAPIGDHPDRVDTEQARVALALLTPDAIGDVDETSLAEQAAAWLRRWTAGDVPTEECP